MGKIRTVKPELFRHPALYEAEKRYQLPLRLAFIGLFTCCDREGRFKWEPRVLKLDILPYDDTDFEQILEALGQEGFIHKYTVQNKHYAHIPSWHNHQSINKHEPLSRLPEPLPQIASSINNSMQYTNMHMQAHAMPPQIESQPTANNSMTKNNTSSINTITYKPNSDLHMHAHAMHDNASTTQMSASLEVELEMEEELEKEYEMEMGENRNIVAPARRRSNHEKNIAIIFHHWKTTLHHPNALLDDKRQKNIKHALDNGYSVEQICDAITGCAQTPHNMGKNDNGQIYDGLHIILKNADQIERFIRNRYHPPQPSNSANQLLENNVSAGKNWLTHHQNRRTTHED